jgi:cell division protein FtsB
MSSFQESIDRADMLTAAYLEMQTLSKELSQLHFEVDTLRSQQAVLEENAKREIAIRTLPDAFSFV